ncbi:MAG TPA: efflux RND transporter periplasmic adaptor subunit [Candidatus Sulfotelmatobacter sp.]|jgi:RND family efflux transporter MFP subunit|nr:efflux RND transporter periplasmic adaptor subunit [Candidatus Sulfotelmatobacter sp.]
MKTAETRNHYRNPRTAAFVAAVLLVTMWVAACADRKKLEDDPANAPHAAVVKVSRQDLTSTLEIASELQPFQEIDVYAKVAGYIQKLNVDWGTHVKQGDVLAVLEIPELQQQVQQDEAAVRRSQQDLARSREDLARAQSTYSVAHVTYQRLIDVQKTRPELMAQQEIDVAQGKDTEASAGVSAAQDSQAAAEEGIASAKALLEKDKAMFAYARIIAPFDGVVTRIDAYKGALLPAGTSTNSGNSALCHLSQVNLLRLVIPVPERAVPDIRAGENVAVEVSALKKTFSAQIVRLADQIDAPTRTMHTELNVPNPNYELVPGMYASAKIPLHTASNVLTIPIQSVVSNGTGEGSVLLVNNSHHLEKRSVKLGLESATDYEIISGLREGELVVFGEQEQYRGGELVQPNLVNPAGME